MKNRDKTLFTLLREYGESDFYPYHMPGHKRKGQGDFDERILGIDITEIDGFDNLHQPNGILLDCQRRAAGLYGSDESFFLINGSTCGILSAISAALPVGGHILMARGSHKSAYHAAYLRKLKITYIYSDINEKFDICEAVSAADIEKLLDENTDIGAVYIVSPTYEGRIADVGAIAETVHKRGIPLIVDEAHGAHLGFADGFAKNSCQLKADIVIHSVHKTLPAMTQTALLHVNGGIVDRDKLRRFLHIYQSSSPSYILMAGIDNAMQMIENEGRKLFADFRDSDARRHRRGSEGAQPAGEPAGGESFHASRPCERQRGGRPLPSGLCRLLNTLRRHEETACRGYAEGDPSYTRAHPRHPQQR